MFKLVGNKRHIRLLFMRYEANKMRIIYTLTKPNILCNKFFLMNRIF